MLFEIKLEGVLNSSIIFGNELESFIGDGDGVYDAILFESFVFDIWFENNSDYCVIRIVLIIELFYLADDSGGFVSILSITSYLLSTVGGVGSN